RAERETLPPTRPIAARRVEKHLRLPVAVPEPLRQRHADLRAACSHLMRNVDDGHGSPPPILVSERGRRDRDALAADVVQDVDLERIALLLYRESHNASAIQRLQPLLERVPRSQPPW